MAQRHERRPARSPRRGWRLVAGALLALVLGFSPSAFAQREAFAQMADLLEKGYYNSAARLNGPDLVARFPEDPEAHFLYARALYLTGDLVGAREQLDVAIALAGDEVPAYFQLGALLMAAEGDPVGALRQLQNAFLRTRDYDYAMEWGRVAWQAARYDEAIQAFQAAADTEEGAREPWPFLDLGRVLMLSGRLDEAIVAFNTAIDVYERFDPGAAGPGSPAYVEAYFRLGEVYEMLGELDRAETHYRAARTADPNYGPAVAALDRLSRTFE